MKKKNYIVILTIGILLSTIFIIIGTSSLALNTSSNDPLIVETEYGLVRGKEWDVNTYSWLGIPFAKPPIGELRWKAPVDPDPWSGIMETVEFPEAPMQFANWMGCVNEDDILNHSLIGSEDCLYLNVWTPKSSDSSLPEGLPVYVYIFGGGNIVGQSNFPIYYGANLANRANCVVVTMNYRVGIAGWHYNPALHVGNPLDDSGNYGLLDIFKSFEWVKTNIENFGGDSNTITIAGESAGAMNAYASLTSPYLKQEFFDRGTELFHRAVMESGGILPRTIEEGIAASDNLLGTLLLSKGLASNMTEAMEIVNSFGPAQKKQWLLNEPMENFYNLFIAEDFFGLTNMMAVAPSLISDGYVCSSNPYAALIEGNYIKVPAIIGCNAEEAKVFMSWMLDEPLFTSVMFGHPHPEDLAYYLNSIRPWPVDLAPFLDWIIIGGYELTAEVISIVIQLVGVDIPATLMRMHQKDVFCYQFAWNQEPEPFDFLVGACHGSEIPFIFGNVGEEESFPFSSVLWSDQNIYGRKILSNSMISYWSNFMRNGNPGDPDGYFKSYMGLPRWTAYTSLLDLGNKRIIFDATDYIRVINMAT
ncbi:MAG: carboxylesterase/lipase family protein [Promethearchaeota archaeon]